MAIRWGRYVTKGFYDELIRVAGKPRPVANILCDYLHNLRDSEIEDYKSAAEIAIQVMGISFTVYTEEDGSIDRARIANPLHALPRRTSEAVGGNIDRDIGRKSTAIHNVWRRRCYASAKDVDSVARCAKRYSTAGFDGSGIAKRAVTHICELNRRSEA